MGNKQDQCAAAGTASFLTSVGGLALMVAGGPVGLIAGAAMMSGGIGRVSNSISQSKDPNSDEFQFGNFAGHVAVNASVGAATGGVGAGAHALGRAAQVATIVAISSVGSGVKTVACNTIDDKKDILEGVGKAMVTGAINGSLAVGVPTYIDKSSGQVAGPSGNVFGEAFK